MPADLGFGSLKYEDVTLVLDAGVSLHFDTDVYLDGRGGAELQDGMGAVATIGGQSARAGAEDEIGGRLAVDVPAGRDDQS